MKKLFSRAALAALTLASPLALAHQAGDLLVRAGAITVDPHEKSGKISLAGVGKIAGTKATADSSTQLGVDFTYMVADHVGIDVLAATPFKHNIGTRGTGVPGLDKLGSTKQLPPTVSLLYYPLESSSIVQPYVGAGVTYAYFFDSKLNNSAKASGASNGLHLKNSWGWGAQLGMDVDLGDNFLFNAQVRYVNLDTTATTRVGGLKAKVDVDVNPFVYMIGVGYKF